MIEVRLVSEEDSSTGTQLFPCLKTTAVQMMIDSDYSVLTYCSSAE